jgi:predicted RNase H-like HicB family nuclease
LKVIGLAKLRLTILIWEEEGAYVSRCQELEVASCGDTPEEALDNIREAIELYLENARELGILQDIEPILTSRHKFTSVIEVEA